MAKQTTPHIQTQQNTTPEQTDFEPEQERFENNAEASSEISRRLQDSQTGDVRSPRKVSSRSRRRKTEPEAVAHVGGTATRTPKGPGQGLTGHSAVEESIRQEKVVKDRPDAQAGVNQQSKVASPHER